MGFKGQWEARGARKGLKEGTKASKEPCSSTTAFQRPPGPVIKTEEQVNTLPMFPEASAELRVLCRDSSAPSVLPQRSYRDGH